MKSNELRIDNLLRDKVSKTELKVIGLTESNITTYVIDRSMFPLKDGWGIEPIPLTEEWLLKFGFGDITNECASKAINIKTFCKTFRVGKCIEQQTLFIELGTRGWTFKRVGYPLYNYVHQLQNLYFALVGEELIQHCK